MIDYNILYTDMVKTNSMQNKSIDDKIIGSHTDIAINPLTLKNTH